MTPADAASDVQQGNSPSAGTAIVIMDIVLIALLLLSIVVALVMTVYQFPRLSRLRDADLLVQLFTNLVVACYAVAAFEGNKKGEFLALGLSGLLVATGALYP